MHHLTVLGMRVAIAQATRPLARVYQVRSTCAFPAAIAAPYFATFGKLLHLDNGDAVAYHFVDSTAYRLVNYAASRHLKRPVQLVT